MYKYMMFSCNCSNIVLEVEKNEKSTKEILELTNQDKTDTFFNQDSWFVAKLHNISKVHPGLIRTRQYGLWNITQCLNCQVQTHAIHKEKGASSVLVHCKLLNSEAIKNMKKSDLVSSIFNIIVNPNGIEPDMASVDSCASKIVEKHIKDFNDVVTNVIRQEQLAVEERIKKYSDEQYELLNVLKDKAYKEREVLVRIIQSAAREDSTEHDLSPKSPKPFGKSSDKHSASNSPLEVPFSPKRPKSLGTEKNPDNNADTGEDLMFDFETEGFSDSRDDFEEDILDQTYTEDVDEASDVIREASGMAILNRRSVGSAGSIAKSCPVDIPIFSQSVRSRNSRSEDEDTEDLSPRPDEQLDIAASIKALARSVHGDTIFGELPRPRFSTQI